MVKTILETPGVDGATSTWTQIPLPKPKPNRTMLFTIRATPRRYYGGFDGRFYSLTTYRWRDGSWHKQFPAPVSERARDQRCRHRSVRNAKPSCSAGLADRQPD